MNLLLVSKGFYTVYAVAKSREHCELLEFLEGLGQTLQKDSDRMLALLGRVSMEGPPRNTEISHQIKGKLFEFTPLLHKDAVESTAYPHQKAVSTFLRITSKGHSWFDPGDDIDLTAIPLWVRVG